ncbi:hypothetical protein SUGI_0253540 [Cryptomeria japonica]|nr:hypothetical protein SUGI_0253540 [Cryptomeria japonica]
MMRVLLIILALLTTGAVESLDSGKLCKACSKCTEKQCPKSDSYPHMTAFDGSLIAGAFQSDYVSPNDPGVYAVPDVKGGEGKLNAYYGWKSVSGSASGYHRFENYMDKCSNNRLLMAIKDSKVGINKATKENLASAEWKRINAPKNENHKGFSFWQSRNTGLCLTVGKGKGPKRPMVMEKCKLDGSVTRQLFAFRFHYRNAFCCCNLHNKVKN